jgi:hypothetical protein
MTISWGLLGPEVLPDQRRTRSLGLAKAVRHYNQRAVPGLGNVWFARQIFLALLGIEVATRARQSSGRGLSNIVVTNAIEALACWLAYSRNGWRRDRRLCGRTKLRDHSDLAFKKANKPGFYVSQPMRMATGEALLSLGLVESSSSRFNSFECSDLGKALIEEATDAKPFNRDVVTHLLHWVLDEQCKVDTDALAKALSPLERLKPTGLKLLRSRLLQQGSRETAADASRRRNVMGWVEELNPNQSPIDWSIEPPKIKGDHWRDLKAGAFFFGAMQAALEVLDAVESHMANNAGMTHVLLSTPLTGVYDDPLDNLRKRAQEFLDCANAEDPADARVFCKECSQEDAASQLRHLIDRDGRVLHRVDDRILPGPAFQGHVTARRSTDDNDDAAAPQPTRLPLPPQISQRVTHLFLLSRDLKGELEEFL